MKTAVEKRRDIEKKIVRRVIRDGLKAGYALRVHDGEEFATDKSTNEKELFDAMFATDMEYLLFHKDGKSAHVLFVYGNGGYDVMADYSTSLEEVLKEAFAYAETFDK